MSLLNRSPWEVAKEIRTPGLEIDYLVAALLDAMDEKPVTSQGQEFAATWHRFAWGVDLLVALAIRCPEHRELRHYGTLINYLAERSDGEWPGDGDSEGDDSERILVTYTGSYSDGT